MCPGEGILKEKGHEPEHAQKWGHLDVREEGTADSEAAKQKLRVKAKPTNKTTEQRPGRDPGRWRRIRGCRRAVGQVRRGGRRHLAAPPSTVCCQVDSPAQPQAPHFPACGAVFTHPPHPHPSSAPGRVLRPGAALMGSRRRFACDTCLTLLGIFWGEARATSVHWPRGQCEAKLS